MVVCFIGYSRPPLLSSTPYEVTNGCEVWEKHVPFSITPPSAAAALRDKGHNLFYQSHLAVFS
jgi:hypothetical protein